MSEFGKQFIARRRLSDADNHTLAEVGQTCERVPAAKGGTVEEALARLEASGKIERNKPKPHRKEPA